MLKKLIDDGWIGAVVMVVIAWFGVSIIDAEAIKTGQMPIMPGLKVIAIGFINNGLSMSVGAINSSIATIYPYRQVIALIVLVIVGVVAWRWTPTEKEESQPIKERWNVQRIRRGYKEI